MQTPLLDRSESHLPGRSQSNLPTSSSADISTDRAIFIRPHPSLSETKLDNLNKFSCWKPVMFFAGFIIAAAGLIFAGSGFGLFGVGEFITAPVGACIFAFGVSLMTGGGVLWYLDRKETERLKQEIVSRRHPPPDFSVARDGANFQSFKDLLDPNPSAISAPLIPRYPTVTKITSALPELAPPSAPPEPDSQNGSLSQQSTRLSFSNLGKPPPYLSRVNLHPADQTK